MPNLRQRPDAPVEHANEQYHRRLIAERANVGLPLDGTKAMSAPLLVMTYTVATLPTASLYANSLITVSNEAGGYTVAFSDGTNWRRVQDRAIVS